MLVARPHGMEYAYARYLLIALPFLVLAASRAFLDEDRLICERGQRGMAARHSQGGQLVELERIVGDFHQYLGTRLFDHEPAPLHRAQSVRP